MYSSTVYIITMRDYLWRRVVFDARRIQDQRVRPRPEGAAPLLRRRLPRRSQERRNEFPERGRKFKENKETNFLKGQRF